MGWRVWAEDLLGRVYPRVSSNTLIGMWASGIWQVDLGASPYVSALTISGFAIQPSTLGLLNSYLGLCFSGSGYSGAGSVNYDVVPDIGQEELAIVEQLYLISYYNSLANATMGQGGDNVGGLPYTTIRDDGGLALGRANPAAIGLAYISQAKEAVANMRYLVNNYINNVQGANTPRSVSYPDLVYPIWSNAFIQ